MVVITDQLGKGVILDTLKKIDAKTVAQLFIDCVFHDHGLPKSIVLDRGSAFVSALWAHICQLLGIT